MSIEIVNSTGRESSDAEWERFTQGLALQLSELPETSALIVETSGGRCAQFSQDTDELESELTANRYLDEQWQVSAEAAGVLRTSGWAEPVVYDTSEQPDEFQQEGWTTNWWRSTPWPASYSSYVEVARQVVHGLRGPFKIESVDELSARSVEHEPHRPELDLSALRQAIGEELAEPSAGEPLPAAQNTGQPRVDVDGAEAVLRAWLDFDWTWATDDVARVCDRLGWTPSGPTSRQGFATVPMLVTRMAIERPEAHGQLRFASASDPSSGSLRQLQAYVTDAGKHIASQREFLVDAFATLAARLTAVAGAPAHAVPGRHPTLRWNHPAVTIELRSTAAVISLVAQRPEH